MGQHRSTEICMFMYVDRALSDAREFGWEFSDQGIYSLLCSHVDNVAAFFVHRCVVVG